jgi:serine/threonine protein kinase
MTEEYTDLSNYILKEDIGKGNFGKVKLGIYKPTNEEFAIKIINKKMIKIKMKNVIFKENEIITKFNHINVIYVYQIIDTPENYYIIMEYCKRGELFDYIVDHQKLDEDEASIFFYQLINGIEYIHSKGIAHRDLKPENLLLTEDKILKIIDFGLSHEFNGEDFLKTKCGSPSYASPEIISHPFYDGFKTDIWCCGIILYAMLCGYLPFDGDDNETNNNTLFKNIVECNLEFPEDISETGKDLIFKLLEVEPEERITIPDIKKHPFYIKGKTLCKLDYDLIEENIIKKRSHKNTFINSNSMKRNNKSTFTELNNIEINNNKYKFTIETDDNQNINNEEDKKNHHYYPKDKDKDNLLKNNNNDNQNQLINNVTTNHNQNNNSIQVNKNINNINNNMINFYKINNEQMNYKNNKIIKTEINKYNPNIPMLKLSNNFNLIDKILSSKINYTKKIEQDKLFNNNYLYTINRDKRNIFKPSLRDILKDDKNSFYFNAFGNKNNKYHIKNENPELSLDKKNRFINNDNKTFNDEIFLRNFRSNLIKKEKINKEKNQNICVIGNPNNTINIENKNNRVISLSNDNKVIKRNICIKDNCIKLNNIKKIMKNYEENNNSNKNNNIISKIKFIPTRNNDIISSNKYTNNEFYKDLEDKINNNNNSFAIQNNKNTIRISKENYKNNKEHIYKSENNYKRKDLSLENNYRKIDDKINLSKLIKNINQENEYKTVNRKKNKSFFNRLNINSKTIESYNISNRNNTIENNRIPVNLTKKLKNYNFDFKNNDRKNIKEEKLNNRYIKNTRMIRIKNNGFPKNTNNHFLPILTDNNRNNIHYNIKKI